ncbi:MAG: YggT family protein [Chloroflexota bacterium]|nr:YggT family protein [Chloroflexota bacterium]
MRDDRSRSRYEGDDDPYTQETQAFREVSRSSREPDTVDNRYVDPAPYAEPEPVRERYVEERYTERPVVQERYTQRRPVRSRSYTLARYARLIYFIFGVIESLIAIRAVLKLLAANPRSGFASLIYGITDPFVAPFTGLFSEPRVSGSVLEFRSLVAILVYALLAFALVRLLYLFSD